MEYIKVGSWEIENWKIGKCENRRLSDDSTAKSGMFGFHALNISCFLHRLVLPSLKYTQ